MKTKTLITALYGLILIGMNQADAQTYTISTLAGSGTPGYSGDGGPASTAELHWPGQLTVDDSGSIYICDWYNNAIRKVNTSGVISTVVSGGGIYGPSGVAVDATGNVYFAEVGNNVINKVTTTGVITKIAGNGNAGYAGDGGQATNAMFLGAYGLALDAFGNVYVADCNNHRIRKISTAGIITTVAGTGMAGYGGDGGLATNAQLNRPTGIDIDAQGYMYIADEDNNRIRKISPTGIITTIAGNGTGAHSGDGGLAIAAALNVPDEVVVDANGNIYIAEYYSNVIRKIDGAGIITTIAGNGSFGFAGDGGPAIDAEFNGVYGVAIDASGNIYIGDQNNNRIRKLSVITGIEQPQDANYNLSVFPNPSAGTFQLKIPEELQLKDIVVTVIDFSGREVFKQKQTKVQPTIDISDQPNGLYFIAVTIDGKQFTSKVVVSK
jgi:sugar lactone lactonase YvrE